MMDSPLYGRRYWNSPSSSYTRSHHKPIVREIPVKFFGSEEKRPSRSDSAVKIQKLIRGFLVRKSVKKIAGIKKEVEEIEKRISKEQTIDLIARDSKERLRINEMLMSLLFRLDSVRGVDNGVRDCRKTVIRKAIALQELLDAVVSSNNNKNDQNSEKVAEGVDDQNSKAQVEIMDDSGKTEADINQNNEAKLKLDNNEAVESQNDVGDKEADKNQNNDGEAEEEAVEDFDVMPSVNAGLEQSVGTIQTESQTDSSANPEAFEEDENSSQNQQNNAIETREAEEEVEENVKGSGGASEGHSDENTKNRELLERMMEDNERMMDLMAQLFERNEMQTRLLSSLSHRVNQLERAFMCEVLRKKNKKRRNASGTVDDDCETTPGNKKCGKRE